MSTHQADVVANFRRTIEQQIASSRSYLAKFAKMLTAEDPYRAIVTFGDQVAHESAIVNYGEHVIELLDKGVSVDAIATLTHSAIFMTASDADHSNNVSATLARRHRLAVLVSVYQDAMNATKGIRTSREGGKS